MLADSIDNADDPKLKAVASQQLFLMRKPDAYQKLHEMNAVRDEARTPPIPHRFIYFIAYQLYYIIAWIGGVFRETRWLSSSLAETCAGRASE